MGGTTIRYEPKTLEHIWVHPYAYHIFTDVGWLAYFKWLCGFNNIVALEFTRNLEGNNTTILRLRVEVIEDTIIVVRGLLQVGIPWFGWKASILAVWAWFFQGGEEVRIRRRGIDRHHFHTCGKTWNTLFRSTSLVKGGLLCCIITTSCYSSTFTMVNYLICPFFARMSKSHVKICSLFRIS